MSKHTWDFNSDTSSEAIAAWNVYRNLPVNPGMEKMDGPAAEQDCFTAGFDAARSRANDLVEAINALVAVHITTNQILRDGQRAARTVGL